MRAARLALLAVLLAACSESPAGPEPDYRPTGTPRQLTLEEEALATASTGFGLALLREVAAGSDENVLVSPLSVSYALGMALNAVAGPTREEIRTTLGFGGMSDTQINEAYLGLLNQVRLRDRDVTLGVANSVWHDQHFEIRPEYGELMRTYFDAEVGALDFASPAAPDAINGWVSDATGGRIPQLIESIAPDEVAFLVNAVYFKAGWSTPFDVRQTRADTFRPESGAPVSMPFMHRQGMIALAELEDVVAVELPYADSAFAMVLGMPRVGSIDAWVATLDPARWDALLDALVPAEIMLGLPKFTFTMEQDLGDALEAMGIVRAFQPDLADFSPLTPAPEGLYISRVQHNTFIKVDEVGTEAAAATAIGIGRVSAPPAIIFDRPFVVVIHERETGAILFAGVVRRPI
jgi:serpin B